LSPDKKLLFVSCRGKNFSPEDYFQPGPEWGTVLIFDTTSGKLVDAIIGGNQPTALDISPDGRTLVFSDFLDSQLEFYQVPGYKELKNNKSPWLVEYKSYISK
jgi:sugar lactone lactonase YvrE